MIQRYYKLFDEIEDGSVFLFGARQTGKSTFLAQQFGNAITFDLLDGELKRRFRVRPSLLFELLHDKPEGTIVVIDEFPESRCIMVSRDKLSRRNGNIEVLYVFDFLKMLWEGKMF